MGNMSYCRFENTVQDLKDCYEHICDDDLSNSEERARKHLVAVCKQIIEEYEFNYDN